MGGGGYLFKLFGTELIRRNWICTKYSIAKSCSRFSKALYPTLREEWQHIIRQSNARLGCSNGDLLMSISSYGLLSCSINSTKFYVKSSTRVHNSNRQLYDKVLEILKFYLTGEEGGGG